MAVSQVIIYIVLYIGESAGHNLTCFGFGSIIKKIIKLDSTFFYTSNIHISATNEHLFFYSMAYNFVLLH